MGEVCLRTEDLSVGYNGKPLIRQIALRLRRGEIVTLIGPNGAGKSTILKSIIRQLDLVRGAVYLDGRDMAGLTERDVSLSMSVLMTAHVRPELMTCFDVAATGRYPYTGRLGILTREDREKVYQCLELVHAADLAGADFSRISDGQRQRVLLARALCQEPEVMVLDEPTSFLDIRHKLELLAILKDMVRQRKLAVLMSLHELDLAQKISDFVVCVRGDVIDRQGPPEEIFTSDYIMEGLLRSLIHSTRIAASNPTDYEARSNIMWIATWALNTLVAMGKSTDWMVHMIGQSVGAYTDATHGMTLSAVSMPYYRFIMPFGLPKFKRYAIQVWGVSPAGKSDEEIAGEGLDRMEKYMKEMGLVMNLRELGVTDDMLEGIADGSFIMEGGYKTLSHEEIVGILKESMKGSD